MRILHVLAGANHGGAETACIDMCIAMHEAGHVIEVVTRSNAIRVPRLQKAGIKVHCLPFGGKLDFYTPLILKKIIRGFRPDIVQTWMSRASDKTPRWHASMGIPRYATVARLGGYYKLKYYQSTDYFITITPDIRRHLVDLGVPENTVQHINNFAETEEAMEPASRAAQGIPPDAPLLFGLGRLHTSKAFDTLIKVVSSMEGVYLWIAGEGPMRGELEHLINELNIGDRVKLLGWRSDRAALFQASDICVFSSRYEPFGTVFVQSWAQKVPLVTTRADGPKQFVRDEEDGLVVPIDDEKEMRKAIERLLADSELRNKLVLNGYKRYIEEFTKEKSVAAYIAYYQDIRNLEKIPLSAAE